MAYRSRPYLIVPLEHGDVIDYGDISRQIAKCMNVDTNGGHVNWLKIRWIRVCQEEKTTVLFKYDIDEPEFHQLSIISKSGSWHGSIRPIDISGASVRPRYTSRQLISEAKLDLLDLCD